MTRGRLYLAMWCALVGGVCTVAVLADVQQALTEVERLQVRVLSLEAQLRDSQADADACRAILGPLRAADSTKRLQEKLTALKKDIEAGHPGFTWDPSSGELTAKGK